MEKVKVTRYMTGKRPDWAPEEFDSDEELQLQAKKITIKKPGNVDIEKVSFFLILGKDCPSIRDVLVLARGSLYRT